MNMWKCFGMAALFGLLLGGCSQDGGLTDAQYVQSAQQSLAEGDLIATNIYLKNALQANPQNKRARWLLGRLHLELGNGAAAEKELSRARELGVVDDAVLPLLARAYLLQAKYNEVLRLKPEGELTADSRGELLASQALAFMGKGDAKNAEQKLGKALERSPESVYVLASQARFLWGTGHKEEGRDIIKTVVERDPENADAWSLLGDMESQEGNLESALAAYTKAVDSRIPDSQDRLKRALLRIQLKQFDAAKADIEILKKRGFRRAAYADGILQFMQERYEAAVRSFAKALKDAPGHVAVTYYLALANLAAGNVEQAEQQAARVLALDPRNGPGRLLLARIKARRGLYAEVAELLRPVVASAEGDLDAANLLATALLRLGKSDEAVVLLEKIADAQPDSANAQLRLGVGFLAAGDGEKGVEHLLEAIKIDPGFPKANILLIANYLQAGKFDQAFAAAKEFKSRAPDSPLPETMLGMVFLAQEETQQAEAAFERANAIAPGDFAAGSYLAMLAIKEGDLDRAEGHYEEILKRYPGQLATLMRLARLESNRGDLVAMEKRLRAAISAHPHALEPRIVLGRRLLEQKKTREALELLEVVGEQGQNSQAYLTVLGTAHLMDKAPEKAKSAFERSVELGADSAEVYYLLGRLYAELDDGERAERSLQQSLKADPDYYPARFAYTQLQLLKKDTDAAHRSLTKLLATAGDRAEVKFLEGLIAAEKETPEQALDILQSVYESVPTTSSMMALSRQHWNMGNKEAALAVQEKWLAGHTDSTVVRYGLARAYADQGQVEKAVAQYRAILERSENDLVALNNLAWYLKDSEPKSALRYAEKAAGADPDSPRVLDTLAVVLASNGEFERAERAVDRALEKVPDNPSLRYRKAVILDMAGKRQEAAELLDKLLNGPQKAFAERQDAEKLLNALRDGS